MPTKQETPRKLWQVLKVTHAVKSMEDTEYLIIYLWIANEHVSRCISVPASGVGAGNAMVRSIWSYHVLRGDDM